MIGKTYTYNRMGLFCNKIEVEVDLKRGLPNILISGLLSQEVREARERIRPAIANSGIEFPMKRITINLSPAESIKSGTHFDLAIAISILCATQVVELQDNNAVFFGELNLSGQIKRVRGILPMIIEAEKDGFDQIFIPVENYQEVKFLNNPHIIPVHDIIELIEVLDQGQFPEVLKETSNEIPASIDPGDFSDIKGQKNIIQAFKIAAAGHHHMLLLGPPGSGKTMSASRLPTIIPDLTNHEIIEINKIYSIISHFFAKYWITFRPFRTPHNSASMRALVGGGPQLLPGEVSLAHKGILFLDEFLEFRSDTLQALRVILEKKRVSISLRNGYAVYPADFLLVAAANPCACGFYNTEEGYCTCSMTEIKKYKKKIRNPLIDRIDIHVKVSRVNYKNLVSDHKNETSAQIKKQVMEAREIQQKRYASENFRLNSQIPAERIEDYCLLNSHSQYILENYIETNLLTARSCHKILKLARTIADLHSHEVIEQQDIFDAIQYRFLDTENY